MRLACLLAVVSAALLAAGCLGGDDPAEETATLPPAPVLTGAHAQAPASTTAGTLAQVPDGDAARTRLAYANVDALRAAELPVSADRVLRRVLGRVPAAGAIAIPAPRGPRAAGERDHAGRPERGAVVPRRHARADRARPGTMGRDAALGVGLAESGDAPAGIQLRICGAPHFIRDIHAMQHALEARFGGGASVIGEKEIGEREIVFATVAADAVRRGRAAARCSPPAPSCARSAGAEPLRSPTGYTALRSRRRSSCRSVPANDGAFVKISKRAAIGLLGRDRRDGRHRDRRRRGERGRLLGRARRRRSIPPSRRT